MYKYVLEHIVSNKNRRKCYDRTFIKINSLYFREAQVASEFSGTR